MFSLNHFSSTCLSLSTHLIPFIQEQEVLTDPLMSLSSAEIKGKLIEKYQWSEYATTGRARIKQILNIVSMLSFSQGHMKLYY